MLRISQTGAVVNAGGARRDLLQAGALSLISGMTLPRLLRAAEGQVREVDQGLAETAGRRSGAAKSVILFNLLGGPSHLDMFDMKPGAPLEIRGQFSPIQTSLSGVQICEHLPNTARIMHRLALIRSVTHNYNAHNPLNIMTGFSLGNPSALIPAPTDPPDIGAVCQYLGLGPGDMPGAVCLPCYPGWGESSQYPGIRRPGPYGGWLGAQYDPLFSLCEPTFDRKPDRPYYGTAIALGEPRMPAADALPDMTLDRLDRRRSMLQQLDRQFSELQSAGVLGRMDRIQQKAFGLLTTSRVREAFDLSGEPEELRRRYGRSLFGNCMLVARRLVEAEVPFVSVHAENFLPHGSFTYDMHENNFAMLQDHNLPVLDALLPALIEDLEQRGLLDSTIVWVMGEMGRSPKINAKAGREHWPQCGFCLLAGGGIRPGVVYGSSDAIGAWPASDPVTPADIVATIYNQLGIDAGTMLPDRTGRPLAIAHGGVPIWDVIG